MKKNLLTFMFALCLIIPCAVMLSACGGNNKCCCTIEDTLPEYVTFDISDNGSYSSDDKGVYFDKDKNLTITIRFELGYDIGTLKVFANGEEINLIKNNGEYTGSYTCTQDFSITFTGTTEMVVSNINLKYEPFINIDEYENDIYMKIVNYENYGFTKEIYTLSEIKIMASNGINMNVRALEPFEYYIYANGYNFGIENFQSIVAGDDYALSDHKEYFYHEDDNYGLKYSINFYENANLVLAPYISESIDIQVSGNGTLDNDLYKITVNNEDRDYVEYSDFNSNNKPVMNIELKKYNDNDYKSIYDSMSIQFAYTNIPFQIIQSGENAKISITLEKPFNYANDELGNIDTQYLDRYYINTDLFQKLIDANLTVDVVTNNKAIYIDDIKSNMVIEAKNENYLIMHENSKLFLKTSYVKYEISLSGEQNFNTFKINDITTTLDNNTNTDLKISKNYLYDGDEIIMTVYTVEILATISFDNIYLYS